MRATIAIANRRVTSGRRKNDRYSATATRSMGVGGFALAAGFRRYLSA
jgi:hypothetical protein